MIAVSVLEMITVPMSVSVFVPVSGLMTVTMPESVLVSEPVSELGSYLCCGGDRRACIRTVLVGDLR